MALMGGPLGVLVMTGDGPRSTSLLRASSKGVAGAPARTMTADDPDTQTGSVVSKRALTVLGRDVLDPHHVRLDVLQRKRQLDPLG